MKILLSLFLSFSISSPSFGAAKGPKSHVSISGESCNIAVLIEGNDNEVKRKAAIKGKLESLGFNVLETNYNEVGDLLLNWTESSCYYGAMNWNKCDGTLSLRRVTAISGWIDNGNGTYSPIPETEELARLSGKVKGFNKGPFAVLEKILKTNQLDCRVEH